MGNKPMKLVIWPVAGVAEKIQHGAHSTEFLDGWFAPADLNAAYPP